MDFLCAFASLFWRRLSSFVEFFAPPGRLVLSTSNCHLPFSCDSQDGCRRRSSSERSIARQICRLIIKTIFRPGSGNHHAGQRLSSTASPYDLRVRESAGLTQQSFHDRQSSSFADGPSAHRAFPIVTRRYLENSKFCAIPNAYVGVYDQIINH